PSTSVRRIRETRKAILSQVASRPISLGHLIQSAAEENTRDVVADPIIALQTFMQAALPANTKVRGYVTRLEDESLVEWARTYEQLFNLYSVDLKPGRTWLDMAELFSTLAEGATLRTRSRHQPPRLSDRSAMLSAGIIAMLPALVDVTEEKLFQHTAI
ncbi:MAG: hypothetical protein ACRCYU_19600, partial [Nocardioides sp.]